MNVKNEDNYNQLKKEYQSPFLSWAKIFWDGVKNGNLLSRAFLLAQNYELAKEDHDAKLMRVPYNLFSKEYKYNHIKVPIPETSNQLDTMEIRAVNASKENLTDEKYAIYFKGQAELYENNFEQLEQDAKKLNQVSIGFNYRGVGNSTGVPRSMDDLVQDGIAQVQRLLDKKVPVKNIRLSGWSLGGAVAILVAAHFHKDGIQLEVFADRTFSSLTNTVVGFIRTIGSGGTFGQNSGSKETWFGKALGFVLKPVVKAILRIAGWDRNIAAAYKQLPKDNKQAVNASSDPIISYGYASLHAGLTNPSEDKVATVHAPLSAKGIEEVDSHNAPLRALLKPIEKLYLTSLKNLEDKQSSKKTATVRDFCKKNKDKLPMLIRIEDVIYIGYRVIYSGATLPEIQIGQLVNLKLYAELNFPTSEGLFNEASLSDKLQQDVASRILHSIGVCECKEHSAEEVYQQWAVSVQDATQTASLNINKTESLSSVADQQNWEDFLEDVEKHETHKAVKSIEHQPEIAPAAPEIVQTVSSEINTKKTVTLQQTEKWYAEKFQKIEAIGNKFSNILEHYPMFASEAEQLANTLKKIFKYAVIQSNEQKISLLCKQTNEFIANFVEPLASENEKDFKTAVDELKEQIKRAYGQNSPIPAAEQGLLNNIDFMRGVGEAVLKYLNSLANAEQPTFRGQTVKRSVKNLLNALSNAVNKPAEQASIDKSANTGLNSTEDNSKKMSPA